MKKFTVGKIFGSAAILLFAYLFFSTPGEVIVEGTGRIDGLANKAREILQGTRFWGNQLQEVESAISWQLSSPERQKEFESSLREVDRYLEEFHKQFPQLRPTPEERQIQALRDRADELESAQTDRLLENFRLERISELRAIYRMIEAKVARSEEH